MFRPAIGRPRPYEILQMKTCASRRMQTPEPRAVLRGSGNGLSDQRVRYLAELVVFGASTPGAMVHLQPAAECEGTNV